MVENTNDSKKPSNGEFLDIAKFIGVASVNVKAINPSNATLRKFGWNIAEGAAEPEYTKTEEVNGKPLYTSRIRFLVQIQDLEDKPIVPMDFYVRSSLALNADKTKGKIIDAYVRTAWGTKEELERHAIPQYASGPADIAPDYKACHPGQEEILKFLFKYLNITPMKMYDSKTNTYVPTKNPGKITIDDWNALCKGNVSELVTDVSMRPDNCVKVCFGIKSDENNHSYQTFLNTVYIGNGATPDRNTGEYTTARKAIDKFNEGKGENNPYTFSAAPVKMWKETATEVKDNSSSVIDTSGFDDDPSGDLPF